MTAPHLPSKTATPNWSVAGFADQTLRQVVRVSDGGATTRVRLTNRYGTTALEVAGATIARSGHNGSILLDTVRTLAMDESPSFRIAPGAEVATDPVPFALAPLESITITLYFAEPTGPATQHAQALATTYRAEGDHRADPTADAFTETTRSWYYLAGVDVQNVYPPRAGVVAFGDSITDGVGSMPDSDNRFPDELAERLAFAGAARPILNAGISGNRITVDSTTLGDAGVRRFRHDVLDQPGVGTVIIFEGINDIGLSRDVPGAGDPAVPVSTAQLIAGLRDLLDQARSRGLRVIGATILPYLGSPYSSAGEPTRDAVNDWIRSSGEYDAVLDFDRLLADPTDPDRMNPAFDSGDHLHPNDAGYRAMAAAVRQADLRQ
ncbi:SGNH/GDSL hydrolase family protein [Nocardia altamirensis]|uniref:SGNH/GDSL hydrolase family protein n=1 Tax=Nocardia altamirensis TaxID=472158 RepID=UPI000A008182|nr:SGNH/GDSL hydrolase family protein [Nocardia altamirensis]